MFGRRVIQCYVSVIKCYKGVIKVLRNSSIYKFTFLFYYIFKNQWIEIVTIIRILITLSQHKTHPCHINFTHVPPVTCVSHHSSDMCQCFFSGVHEWRAKPRAKSSLVGNHILAVKFLPKMTIKNFFSATIYVIQCCHTN